MKTHIMAACDVGPGDSAYQAPGPPPPTFLIREFRLSFGGVRWSSAELRACQQERSSHGLCELLLLSLYPPHYLKALSRRVRGVGAARVMKLTATPLHATLIVF